MPGNTLFDPKEVEDFIENFLNYVKTDFSIDVDDGTFWNDVTKIESVLIKYFTTYRLKNNVLPCSSHVNILQHLKMKMVNTGKRCLGRRLKITV